MTKKRIVVLASGSGSNLQAIVESCKTGVINADVVAVFSNNTNAYALERAEKFGIDAICVNQNDYQSRALFDRELASQISVYEPDLVVLAGFMRILTSEFVDIFAGRMLNVHPSLLPKYTGLHTHQRAIDNADSEHGATVHFVTDDLDGGPLIVQSRVTIHSNDDAKSLAQRLLLTEWVIFPLAVEWFCNDALVMHNGIAIVNKQSVIQSTYTKQLHFNDENLGEFSAQIEICANQQ